MAIKLKHIEASYGENIVLKNINIEIINEKITGIIGPSGSGKTTLIEIMAFFQIPLNGNVYIARNKKIGFVFEFPEKQFFCRTVYDELKYGLINKKNEKRILDVLKIVGLDQEYLDRNPLHLSNGEKRRVAIAAILIANPDIIIFDEPTIGLDKNSKDNLSRIIKLLKNKYKKTIIVVSQDIDYIYSLVDYVCVINEGKLIAYGEKNKVLSKADLLKLNKVRAPQIIELTNKIKAKIKINLTYQEDINELLKDIYRHAK